MFGRSVTRSGAFVNSQANNVPEQFEDNGGVKNGPVEYVVSHYSEQVAGPDINYKLYVAPSVLIKEDLYEELAAREK